MVGSINEQTPHVPMSRIDHLERKNTLLRKQVEQHEADLERIRLEQAERAREWAHEEQLRREQDNLTRQNMRLNREKQAREEAFRRKEQQRLSRPPPKEKEPIFFSGSTQPKRQDEYFIVRPF